MNITFEPYGTGRNKKIMIDGEHFGYMHFQHHGPHGYHVEFLNINHQTIFEPRQKSKRFPKAVEVWSDKVAQRHNDGKPVAPMQERMVAMVQKLLFDGRFPNPDEVRAQKERLREQQDREAAEQRAKREAEFEAKAREAVGDMSEDIYLIDRVIAAMRWAQTQH